MAYAAQFLRFLDHTHTHIHIRQDSSGLVIGPSHRQVRSLSSIQSILTGKKRRDARISNIKQENHACEDVKKTYFLTSVMAYRPPLSSIWNYSILPVIRKPVIRTTNNPARLGPSCKSAQNCTALSCLEITSYRIKYSTVLWLIELQIRRGRKV